MKGRLLIDLTSNDPKKDAELLKHPAVAGVILFAAQDLAKTALKKLTQGIRKINPDLLIYVDQEGGEIQRLTRAVTSQPSPLELGRSYIDDPKAGQEKITAISYQMANELLALGIDGTFAPDLDLHCPQSTIIGGKSRAFHTDPSVVAACGMAWIRGMQKAGMATIGKHFPGHGRVIEDSHIESVTDNKSWDILSRDLLPFRALMPHLTGLMTAHVIYPAIDPNHIVCLSEKWLQYIRQYLAYRGLIISDCLSMTAAQSKDQDWQSVVLKTLQYCDLAILTHQPKTERAQLLALLDRIELSGYQANANLYPQIKKADTDTTRAAN